MLAFVLILHVHNKYRTILSVDDCYLITVGFKYSSIKGKVNGC